MSPTAISHQMDTESQRKEMFARDPEDGDKGRVVVLGDDISM